MEDVADLLVAGGWRLGVGWEEFFQDAVRSLLFLRDRQLEERAGLNAQGFQFFLNFEWNDLVCIQKDELSLVVLIVCTSEGDQRGRC